ncbi:tyrosine-type recombinase/integrase [Sulfurisphaera ohwakuensis]|uniref:tyrosine-type recombinase/integrase n=1 Tax=Sulfurisphaera ohwakuensis TaxID=69656 RepID=UPI00288B6BFA|nr:tyrosine-type recombinase/integrase [Sulfurisphaera ohwakuensis]
MQHPHHLIIECEIMVKIDVNKLDSEQKIRILKKAVEKYGLSYVAQKLGIDRSTLYRYVAGKVKKVPDEIISTTAEMLSVEELSDALYGLKTVDVDPTTAMSVIVKALKDEGFRNFFLTLLYQYMGDYLRTTTNTYIVSEEDVKKFETLLNNKSKSTKDMRMRYLKRVLSELSYELSPDGIREILIEADSPNIARHMANSLKLFIKTVVKEKNPGLAHLLYSSFTVPKGKYKHRPENLNIETLKKIFDAIEHQGAKAYFLLLCETGLRTGEVYSITIGQMDLEHRVIKLLKENETKRAYISFIHPKTTEYLKDVYLLYREEFIKRYEPAVRGIGQDVEKWKSKLFPFQLQDIRYSIKQAMKKVLGKEFRLYDIRSFWASYMLKQGVSPMIINLLQGRAPPEQFKILQNHYFVISDIELQQIYDKYAPRLLDPQKD